MPEHAHGHHPPDLDWAAMVPFAEQEAEVLHSFLDEGTALVADVAARHGTDVRRVLDVGSGPGVGTCVLAERFPAAAVVAVDGSTEMLANVAARAERLGLAERVQTRLVNLPDGLDDLGQADLVWASMVLHHVGDERAALRSLRARLGPGGLLALVEFADPLRLLADGTVLGRPGLWERLDQARAAWLADMRAGLPDAVPSSDLRTMMDDAGYEVLVDRVLTAELDPPLDDRGRQLALRQVKQMREHVEPYAEAGDVAALDTFIDDASPAGILHRPDVFIHASRRLVVSRAA